MPKDFERCVSGGGRVRTVSGPNKEHGLGKGEYVRYCYLKGKAYRGEVKKAAGNHTASEAIGKARE